MGHIVSNHSGIHKNQLSGLDTLVKMLFLLALLPLALAAPQYPANVDPSNCDNYPFCGPSPVTYVTVPGAEKVLAAQKQILHLNYIASLPDVPAAQQAAQLAAMGLNPGKLQHEAEVARVL